MLIHTDKKVDYFIYFENFLKIFMPNFSHILYMCISKKNLDNKSFVFHFHFYNKISLILHQSDKLK